MAGVFISHASADKVIVDHFVDDIIRLGCGVPVDQIFYSSGADTGVPSGKDLLAHVRATVSETSLVIAIISPMYQTRPVCVAELGAAWGKADNLFPIAVPGMERTDLEGVLVGMLVKHLDDGTALDELHKRVSEVVDKTTSVQTWNQYREKWLANVKSYAAKLETPDVISAEEFGRLGSALEGTRSALEQSERERQALETKLEKVVALKDSHEVAEALLPEDEIERFEMLRQAAADALGELPAIVEEAIWYSIFEGGMPRPNGYEDRTRLDEAEEAARNGFLVESSSGDEFQPDDDVKVVADALRAVRALRKMLDEEITESFSEWFHREYGVTPDLRKKLLWDQLLSGTLPWRR